MGEEGVAVADKQNTRPVWLLLIIDLFLHLVAFVLPFAWAVAFLGTIFGFGLPRLVWLPIFLALLVMNFRIIVAQWRSGEELHKNGHCAKCNAGCGDCGGGR